MLTPLEEAERLAARHRTLKNRQHNLQRISTAIGQIPGKPRKELAKNLTRKVSQEIVHIKAQFRQLNAGGDTSLVSMIRRGRRIIREIPIEELYTTYKNHHRLKLFVLKGTACIHPNCNRVGTRLLLTIDNHGSEHVDLFTETFHLMTNDHIRPLSKGGPDVIENKQPMCEYHNQKKSNHLVPY